MKKLYLCCGLIFTVSCATNALPVVDVSESAVKSAVVIPKAYELSPEQSTAWRNLQQAWMKTEYPKLLKQQKLQMNCSGCENIYMDAVFSIDATGKLKHYELVNSKKCAQTFSKALADQFTAWFFTVQFPPALYDLSFEVRLGTGLSC